MTKQPHREERIRHANSKAGTQVWEKNGRSPWLIANPPSWDEDNIYVVDDIHAEIRKEWIDRGKPPVEFHSETINQWVKLVDEPLWDIDKKYRLKEDEPIYYYQWEYEKDGAIFTSSYLTDEYTETRNYARDGWRRIDSSKRTWEDSK